MKKIIYFFSCFSILFLLVSCDDNSVIECQTSERLNGKWRLFASFGGWSGGNNYDENNTIFHTYLYGSLLMERDTNIHRNKYNISTEDGNVILTIPNSYLSIVRDSLGNFSEVLGTTYFIINFDTDDTLNLNIYKPNQTHCTYLQRFVRVK